jgi:hypothetical protein
MTWSRLVRPRAVYVGAQDLNVSIVTDEMASDSPDGMVV